MKRKITVFKEWKLLFLICFIFAINEFTWFDAVGRIGASKTTLIDNPLGAILIVILAYVFLRERLNKLQLTGVMIVIMGVTIALSLTTVKSDTVFGIGEIEAIITAIAVAIYTILTVGLLKRHNAYQVTAFTLLISGLMMQSIWFVYPQSQLPSQINPITWLYLIPALTLPLIVFLPQDMSIIKIGPSLTEVIVLTNIILTVIIQAVLFYNHVPVALPQNLILAIVGGLVSIGGMVCIFMSEKNVQNQ